MAFLGALDKSLDASTRSSTPSSKTSDLEAQRISLSGNHGSLRPSTGSRTLIPTPRSSRQEGRQRMPSHYESIIRKYREIMDSFQDELRQASAEDHDTCQSLSSGSEKSRITPPASVRL